MRRHNVLFLPFGFTDSRGRLSLQFIIMCGMPPKHLFVPPLFAKREDNILPYKRDFIQRRRAGAMFAKQTCHGAKRSMLASRRNVVRSIFRLRTNKRSPTNSVGGDVLDAPHRCSHYLSAEKVVRTYPRLPLGGEAVNRLSVD